METLEDLYTNAFQQHDEAISAANPWGCNQYGHRKGHQGGDGSPRDSRKTKSTKNEKYKTPKLRKAMKEAEKAFREVEEAFDKYTKFPGDYYSEGNGFDSEKYKAYEEWREKFMLFHKKKWVIFEKDLSDKTTPWRTTDDEMKVAKSEAIEMEEKLYPQWQKMKDDGYLH